MKRTLRLVTFSVATLLLLASCATVGRPSVEGRPIQRMAERGVVVIAIDAQKERELLMTALGGIEELGRRSDRISLALRSDSDEYPLSLDTLDGWAVIEGDFPKLLTNTALKFAPQLAQQKSGGASWFSHTESDLSLRTISKDTILATTGGWEETLDRYYTPILLLGEQEATMMEEAAIALWAREPKTFFDLGLELPQSVFTQSETVLVLIDRDEAGSYWTDAYITMQTPKGAQTLSQMVRSGYLAKLKREGRTFQIAELREMFLLEDDRVVIKHMDLSEDQMQQLYQSLATLF